MNGDATFDEQIGEHFHNIAAWNKTHETGWFLSQTRTMLVMERGDDLWLAPFVTNQWLKDGLGVGVGDAPTRFGDVSYAILSHVGEGYIEAGIEPPSRLPPSRIVIRIRHPRGRPMRRVTVNDNAHGDFDPIRETVTLPSSEDRIAVRVEY